MFIPDQEEQVEAWVCSRAANRKIREKGETQDQMDEILGKGTRQPAPHSPLQWRPLVDDAHPLPNLPKE
jgi:hypothetical protein